MPNNPRNGASPTCRERHLKMMEERRKEWERQQQLERAKEERIAEAVFNKLKEYLDKRS